VSESQDLRYNFSTGSILKVKVFKPQGASKPLELLRARYFLFSSEMFLKNMFFGGQVTLASFPKDLAVLVQLFVFPGQQHIREEV